MNLLTRCWCAPGLHPRPTSPDDWVWKPIVRENFGSDFSQKAPCLFTIFSLLLFSGWLPHKAHWKMSSGGVKEAIWGLIDGSRRTTAAMFSDLPMCRPCLAHSEKQEKFFFLKVNATTRHIALYFSSHLCQCFRK